MRNVRKYMLILSFILVLGSGLRLYKLGSNSLWCDEAVFARLRLESGNLLENIRFIWNEFCRYGIGLEVRHFGYGLFTTFWSSLFQGEFMLRLSSVIFGVIGIVLIYKTGELLFGKRTGLIAAFLLSISPFHIYYSQEFRPYALISLLTLISAYCLRKFQVNGKYRFLWGYAISHALNFYMNVAAVLILFAQIIFFTLYLKKYRALLKKWIHANLIILLLIAPGIILIMLDLVRNGGIASVSPSLVSPFGEFGFIKLLPLYTLKNFSAGYNAPLLIGVSTVLLFLGLSISSVIKTRNREALYLCLCCLCIPLFIMYAGQKVIYADRYLISSSCFLYLIVSNGISDLKKPFLIAIAVSLSVLATFSLYNYYRDYLPTPRNQRFAVHVKKENREAAEYIFHKFKEGDIVFHTSNHTSMPFEYYLKYRFKDKYGRKRQFNEEQVGLVLEFSEDSGAAPYAYETWSEMPNIMTKTAVSVEGYDRVWLVFSSREFEEACIPGSKELKILDWMKRHYIMDEVNYFKGIVLYLFRKR